MTAIIITCDPLIEDCEIAPPFEYNKKKYMAQFAVVSIISMFEAYLPLSFWFAYRKEPLRKFLPNDYLYYAWMCMWTGHLATWVLPSFWWMLTFAGVRILDVIYSAWYEYIVSSVCPIHYIVTLFMLIIADVSLTEVPTTPGIKGVSNKEVTSTVVVYALLGLLGYLLVFFFGKDAIMFVDYTLLDRLEWEDPGYLSPSLFGA